MPSESTMTEPRPSISAREIVPPPEPPPLLVAGALSEPPASEVELLEPPPQPAITRAAATAKSAPIDMDLLLMPLPPFEVTCGIRTRRAEGSGGGDDLDLARELLAAQGVDREPRRATVELDRFSTIVGTRLQVSARRGEDRAAGEPGDGDPVEVTGD